MCSQFSLYSNPNKLSKELGIKIAEDLSSVSEIAFPYSYAPVVLKTNIELHMKLMSFSLVPAWSAEPRVKFATHNARLYSFDSKKNKEIPIYEKPTWREAFKLRHCVVPMSGFIEPIYINEFAGNMVVFKNVIDEALLAAGIWEEWVNKSTGEVLESFTILTDEPYPYVLEMGHDRSPVFLKQEDLASWLSLEPKQPQKMIEFLRAKRLVPQLQTKKLRPLKEGWQKKAE